MTREKFLQHFGRRVRAARILKGLTLKECAERAGMSYTNLSMIERGHRSMYVESVPALARTLGVSVQYLLLGDEQKTRRSIMPPETPNAREPEPAPAAPRLPRAAGAGGRRGGGGRVYG